MSLLENTGSPYVATRIIDTLDAAAEEFRNVEDGFDKLRQDVQGAAFISYEVATFRLPQLNTQGAAVPRRLYLFTVDNVLAFFSPEVGKWITLAAF